MKDLTEGNAARCFLQHFGRYGPPHEIVTDQGAQFINKVVKTLLASQDVSYYRLRLHTLMSTTLE